MAACTSPGGNAGDIAYSSVQGVLAYCNGTNWISMGSTSTTTFGTLTTNSFCAATSSTAIACTTASTGSGNVVLSAAPTLTGTVTGVSSTWSTGVAIGTTTISGALNIVGTVNIAGTVNGTSFVGSGASLTGIGTSALGGITGTPSSSTYLRGDGTWASVSGGTVTGTGTTNYVAKFTSSSAVGTSLLYDSGSAVGINTATPTSTLTVNGTAAYQFGTDYSTATATQNDVAINTASAIRYTGAGSVTFTGIAAGNAGQILYLTNAATSTNTLTLNNQDTGSAAANRIITGSGAALQMANNSSVVLQYDGGASRWRVIGGSGGATPAGYTGQVQYNSGTNTLAANSNLTVLTAYNELVVGTGAATPTGTAGMVATPTVNVIPVAFSYSSLGGASGAVTVNAASTGQMTYYSAANAISGSSNLYVSGANIALGTSSASYLLSLDGQAARTIGMQRDYTAATVGQSLTVNAGGAVSGGTNLNGGNLVLASGVSTGTGTSSIQFQTSPGVAASTTDNTIATAMTILGNGYVGIGSTVPTNKFQISADSTIGQLSVGGSSNYNKQLQLGYQTTGNYGLIQATTSGSSWDNLVLEPSGGNVGIGTTNPAYQLDVQGSGQSMRVGSTSTYTVLNGNQLYSNGPLYLNYNNGQNTLLNAVGGGNVGIGTTNPTLAKFQTAGLVGSTAAVFASDGQGIGLVASWPSIGFNSYYNGGSKAINTGYGGSIGVDESVGGITFTTADTVTGQGTAQTMYERMRISNIGNVGISNNSPNAKLDLTVSGAFSPGNAWSTNSIRIGESGSTGGGLGMSYDTSAEASYISSITPGVSWRTLDLYASTVTTHNQSDERLKTNIVDLSHEQGLGGIANLRPVNFVWKDKALNDRVGPQVGLIAQEVQKIFPKLVTSAGTTKITLGDGSAQTVTDTLTLNYEGFIVPLIKAVQELKADNDTLAAQLKTSNENYLALKARLDKLEAASNPGDKKGAAH